MIAANNVMNALFMVAGSAAAAGLAWWGMSAPGVLMLTAAANLSWRSGSSASCPARRSAPSSVGISARSTMSPSRGWSIIAPPASGW